MPMSLNFDKSQIAVYIKKTILCFLSVFITSVGIAMFITIKGGSDAITVWVQGLQKIWQGAFDPAMTYGTMSLYWNIVLLVLAIIFARKHVFIGTFVSALMLGPFINLVEPFFHKLIPSDFSFTVAIPFVDFLKVVLPSSVSATVSQILLLILADVVMSAGIGLSVSLRFGQVAINGLLLKISELTGIHFKWLRVGAEAVLMIIGWLLGGVFGVGSVISAAFTGPLTVFWAKVYNHTLLKALKIDNPQNEFKTKVAAENEMTMQPSE